MGTANSTLSKHKARTCTREQPLPSSMARDKQKAQNRHMQRGASGCVWCVHGCCTHGWCVGRQQSVSN